MSIKNEPDLEFWRTVIWQPLKEQCGTEQGDEMIPLGKMLISYDDALTQPTEEGRLHATVHAMNTLLIAKGVYTAGEFRFQFLQSAQKQLHKKKVSVA